MKNRPVLVKVNAFPPTPGAPGGNPAGVVLGADALTALQKQEIAAQAGFSETAFISRSSVADFKLEFFTPTRQIADCGHATVAAFSVLAQTDPTLNKTSKEILGGIVRKIKVIDQKVFMEQGYPKVVNVAPSQWEARNDNAFLLVEVEDQNALLNYKPDVEAIKKESLAKDWIGVYVFYQADDDKAYARMFAPAYGINEESATGVAAGHLGVLLYQRSLTKFGANLGQAISNFTIHQGIHMPNPSPSLIEVVVKDQGSPIWVGGAATAVAVTEQI